MNMDPSTINPAMMANGMAYKSVSSSDNLYRMMSNIAANYPPAPSYPGSRANEQQVIAQSSVDNGGALHAYRGFAVKEGPERCTTFVDHPGHAQKDVVQTGNRKHEKEVIKQPGDVVEGKGVGAKPGYINNEKDISKQPKNDSKEVDSEEVSDAINQSVNQSEKFISLGEVQIKEEPQDEGLVASQERAFECDTCVLLFQSREALERHRKMEHHKKREIEILTARIRKRAAEITQERQNEEPGPSVVAKKPKLEKDDDGESVPRDGNDNPEPGTSSGKTFKKHDCSLCGLICPNIEGLIEHLKLHEEAETKMRQLAASNYYTWLQTMAFMNHRFANTSNVTSGCSSETKDQRNIITGLPGFHPGNGSPGINNPITTMNNILVSLKKSSGMGGGMSDMNKILANMMAMAKNTMGFNQPCNLSVAPENHAEPVGKKQPCTPSDIPVKTESRHQDIVADSVECDICMLLLPTTEAVKNHKLTVHKYTKGKEGKMLCDGEDEDCANLPEGILPGRITGPRTTDRNNPWENDEVKLNGQLYVYTRMKSLDDHSPEEVEREIQRIISLPPPPRNIHSIGKTFQCFVCEMMFYSHETLTSHLKIHLKPFQCCQCKKRFLFQGHLNSHMRTHSRENSFECDACNIRFARRDSFIKHMASHGDTKSFHCNYCNKDFRQKSVFDIHLRIHTGEKPYECNVCNMRFSHATTYRRHTMIHTGEKPFECKTCHKKFARKCNLAAHISIHTGDKPFECDQCSMRFAQRSHLTKHHRVHELDRMKPFFCHICKKGYTRRDYFNKHNRIYHTGDNEKPWGRTKEPNVQSEDADGEEGSSEPNRMYGDENEETDEEMSKDGEDESDYEEEEEEEEEESFPEEVLNATV